MVIVDVTLYVALECFLFFFRIISHINITRKPFKYNKIATLYYYNNLDRELLIMLVSCHAVPFKN